MANNHPKRRLEMAFRPFMTATDAPICNQLYSIADSTYAGTTPPNNDGSASYIAMDHRRPSSRSGSQRYKSEISVFFALVVGEAMTAKKSTATLLPKTNIAAVRGSKPARHLHTYLARTNAPMTKRMMSGAAGTHWGGWTDSCNARPTSGAWNIDMPVTSRKRTEVSTVLSRGFPCLVCGSMWNQSSPYATGKWCSRQGPDTQHRHIKGKLEEAEKEEDRKTYQVQDEVRERRKRAVWLETNTELDGGKGLRRRETKDYRTVKTVGRPSEPEDLEISR